MSRPQGLLCMLLAVQCKILLCMLQDTLVSTMLARTVLHALFPQVDPEEMKELMEAKKENTVVQGGEGPRRLASRGQGPHAPVGAQQRGGARSRK